MKLMILSFCFWRLLKYTISILCLRDLSLVSDIFLKVIGECRIWNPSASPILSTSCSVNSLPGTSKGSIPQDRWGHRHTVVLPPEHLDLAGHYSSQDKAFGVYFPLLCSLLSHAVLLPVHYGSIIIVGWNAHNPMKRLLISYSVECRQPQVCLLLQWERNMACSHLPA